MKAPEMRKFRMLLHRRGMTINGVCAAAGVGRSHGSQVLNGKPGRGFWTRRKLARLLKEEELEALGWTGAGEVVGGNVSTKGTILDLERGGEEGNGRKMVGRKMGRPQMNADETKNTKKENLE